MYEKAFFILLGNQFFRFLTYFKRRQWAKILVILASLGIIGLLALGVFFFSYSTFLFFTGYQQYNQPVITYSLAITFVLTFVLTFGSALITALGTLFQRDDNLLLFSWPVSPASIFELRLVDTALVSTWPVFVFALPVVFGYSLAMGLSWISLLLFLLVTLFLTLSATLSGILLATIVSHLWGNLKNKIVLGLGVLVVPFLGWAFIHLLLPPVLTQNLHRLEIDQISQLLDRQTLMNPWLPSTWAVRFVSFWPQSPLLGLKFWYLLAFTYCLILVAILLIRGRLFRQAVDKTAQGRFIAGSWDKVHKKAKAFPYLLKGKFGALTEKDWLMVTRSTSQLLQLGFIFFLQLVYFLIIARVPTYRYGQVFNDQPVRLMAVNFLFINFLASVMGMRFLFPMISLEGHSSWIIWSAPLKRMKIFWQKFIASFLAIFTWMSLATVFYFSSLKIGLSEFWPYYLLNLPMSLALTMITLGIGAIKPNFWEKNPEKLSTSPGGLLATTLCLVYIGLVSLFLFIRPENLFTVSAHTAIWLTSLSLAVLIANQVKHRINHYEV